MDDPFPTEPTPEQDAASSGADDPTAMWGADTLKGMGIGQDEVAPSTRSISASADSTIQGSAGLTNTPVVPSSMFDKNTLGSGANKGMSWPLTIALALGCGVAAYLIATLLR